MERKKNKKIFSISINCPACWKKTLSVKQILDTIPYFGEVLETFAVCKNCGFKTHDILPLSEKKYPKKQKIVVSNKTLDARVIKSKYCSIKIPKIGLKIEPKSSESYVTNIEGVLERIIYSLEGIKKIKSKKRDEIEKKIKILKEAKEGKLKLTIIFKDPTGQSAIIFRND